MWRCHAPSHSKPLKCRAFGALLETTPFVFDVVEAGVDANAQFGPKLRDKSAKRDSAAWAGTLGAVAERNVAAGVALK